MDKIMSSTNNSLSSEHPRNLIPELCRQFYNLGWVTGTGLHIFLIDLPKNHSLQQENTFS